MSNDLRFSFSYAYGVCEMSVFYSQITHHET
jgi:hypothetical protein